MKHCFYILLMFTLVACSFRNGHSGKKCIVEGNLQGVEGGEGIYMVDAWNGKAVLDSTKCKDGTFRFETVAEKPTKVELLYSVLIDCSTGCIIGRDLHGDMLDAKLEELL